MKNQRLRFAQNRIAYIVYSNPGGATQLMHDYGYESPESPHHLVEAIKALIIKNGRKVVKDLLQLHPDKSAILNTQNSNYANFCGACSNHSYNPEDNHCGSCGHSHYSGENRGSFKNRLANMALADLETYYENIVHKANKSPNNNTLAEEVEIVFNELRVKKAEEKQQEENPTSNTESNPTNLFNANSGLVTLALVFVAGIIVGKS